MTFWILAGFFHGEQERLAVPKRRPKPRSFGSIDEVTKSIRKKIIVELPYKLGSKIKLELGTEQAAWLDCADNPYGYKEILICPMKGNLFTYVFYTDGKFSGGGKSLAAGQAYAYTRALYVIVWEIENNKVHIKFRTETDKVKIKQILKAQYMKRGIPLKKIEKMLKHSGFE